MPIMAPIADLVGAGRDAAVFAYREQLREAKAEEKDPVKREAVRSSLKFAETFPEHEKAAVVMGAAALAREMFSKE